MREPSESSLRAPGNITELLNYRLAALVAVGGAPVIRLCEGRFGISRREWHVLGLLHAAGPQSPSDLAASCHLDRARVSRAISALSLKKLVKRSALPTDHRRATVELTASGKALQARVFAEVSAINARLVEGLDDAQLAALHELLAQLKTRADEVRRETATGDHPADRWKGSAARPQWPTGS